MGHYINIEWDKLENPQMKSKCTPLEGISMCIVAINRFIDLSGLTSEGKELMQKSVLLEMETQFKEKVNAEA